ncbi:MAG: hypothetical protein ACI35P_18295 [Bacillus sp. (in: firmicutes)]
MRKNNLYSYLFAGLMIVFVFIFASCSTSTPHESSQQTDFEHNNTAEEFSIESYTKKIISDEIPLSEYNTQYKSDTEIVQDTEYPNFNYKNCVFTEFPEIEELEVLSGKKHGITVQESWDTIENWLKDIGKQDEINMETDVRVVSQQFDIDESAEYPNCYVSFYNHIGDLNSGEGAFIDTNKCHIQIAANGIYSMSDGKITEYLGYTSMAALDALGTNSENVVSQGSLSDTKNKTYPLIDGELSIDEGALMVKNYFLEGTPFPCAEGVTVDIPEVKVFKLGDVYGYDYMVRRVYHSVPFAYMDHGAYQWDENYIVNADIKHAYVVSCSGVTAYAGYNESEKLLSLYTGEKIIGLKQMADLVSEKFAPSLSVQVESVELVYFPISFDYFDDKEEKIIFPCWQFSGKNEINGKYIRIYADVFTSDIYYYTFNQED